MWWNNFFSRRFGLIAGQGEFPVLVAQSAAAMGKPITVIGIEDVTDRSIEAHAKETHYVRFGELEKLIELLKRLGIRRVLFAGGVPKKNIFKPDFRMDSEAAKLIGQQKDRGDDRLLRALALFLKVRCGVRVVDGRGYLKDMIAFKGVLTRRLPDQREWDDLLLGWKAAKAIGNLDIGQSVIVKEKVILAVEGIEGTDEAILRGGRFGKTGSVVVKVSKPNQDLRFDLPCVGPATLKTMQEAGCNVLGIEAGKTLVLFKDKFIEEADRLGMTVVGLPR